MERMMFETPPTDGVETVEIRAGVWSYVLTIDGKKTAPIGFHQSRSAALSAGSEELDRRKPRQR
jgi:hypothetical protein